MATTYSGQLFQLTTPIIQFGTTLTAGHVLTTDADGRATFKPGPAATIDYTANRTWTGLNSFTTPIFIGNQAQSVAFQGYATPLPDITYSSHTIALSGAVTTPTIPTSAVIPGFFVGKFSTQTIKIKKIRGRVDSTTPIVMRLLQNGTAVTGAYTTFQVNGAAKDVVTGDVTISADDYLQVQVITQAATPAYNLSLTLVLEHTV